MLTFNYDETPLTNKADLKPKLIVDMYPLYFHFQGARANCSVLSF
jgi:hypothetical protein